MTTVGITGASGYVGGLVVAEALRRGWDVVALGRRAVPQVEHRPFDLAVQQPVDVSGLDLVVHAAYDFTATGRRIAGRNLPGSLALLAGCQRAGVSPVLVSTLSAFDGARSAYGRVKRDLELAFAKAGGQAVRGGVVFGPQAGGIYGSLRDSVAGARFVPLVGGGGLPLWVTWCEGLAAALLDAPAQGEPLTLACHPDPTTLGGLVAHLAKDCGLAPRTVPVPWWPVYVALRSAELAGLSLSFRSDSVLSLSRTVPADQFARLPFARGHFPRLDEA